MGEMGYVMVKKPGFWGRSHLLSIICLLLRENPTTIIRPLSVSCLISWKQRKKATSEKQCFSSCCFYSILLLTNSEQAVEEKAYDETGLKRRMYLLSQRVE